jgi:hypothetical protein
MKVNDLLGEFGIYTSSEEQTLLDSLIEKKQYKYADFTERNTVVIDNLVKKGLVKKIGNNPITSLFIKNV